MAAVQVGQPFPDITLQTVKYRDVRLLEEYRGRTVVLAWFPFAFSPTCTEQFNGFAKVHSELEDLNATVVGACGDSWWTNEAWRAHLGLPFPILSDWRREAAPALGLFDEKRMRPNRHIHVIDKDGVLRWQRAYGTDECPRLEDFLDVLQDLA